MQIICEIDEKLVVPSATSIYKKGMAYSRDGYEVGYSKSLVRNFMDYYDTKSLIPRGLRMSTAAEELAIQLSLERAGEDPNKADVFRALFGNTPGWLAWEHAYQHTETSLSFPRHKANSEKPDSVDPQGRKYWLRHVGNDGIIEGLVYVPEGNGRLVVEWDEVFGIPKVTEESSQHSPYTTRFWFATGPTQEPIIPVCRGTCQCDGNRYLSVFADGGRRGFSTSDGFRPVRGPLPKIKTFEPQ